MRAVNNLIKKQNRLITSNPHDPNHVRLTEEAIVDLDMLNLPMQKIVLDVGCGDGFGEALWKKHGYEWFGCTIGHEIDVLGSDNVYYVEMHSPAIEKFANHQGVLFARHVLEHSPFPAIPLYNWRGLADYIYVIVPAPGELSLRDNRHLSVFDHRVWTKLFRFIGYDIVNFKYVEYNNPRPWPQDGGEYRYVLR